MGLFGNKISKMQLKSLIKQLETLKYDELIAALDNAALDLAHDENPKYFKVVLAIKKCMEDLRDMYKEEG